SSCLPVTRPTSKPRPNSSRRSTASSDIFPIMPGPPPPRAKPRATLRRLKESPEQRKARAKKILARLKRAYPDATCALHHKSALELLVATILSAQSTDARVNMVTPALFAAHPAAQDYAAENPSALEHAIHSTGFFR